MTTDEAQLAVMSSLLLGLGSREDVKAARRTDGDGRHAEFSTRDGGLFIVRLEVVGAVRPTVPSGGQTPSLPGPVATTMFPQRTSQRRR